MTPEEKAAFINALTQMMVNERHIMLAENELRERQGDSPANGPEQWADWHKRWESVFGCNALISYFRS